jgi:hypothetical protein
VNEWMKIKTEFFTQKKDQKRNLKATNNYAYCSAAQQTRIYTIIIIIIKIVFTLKLNMDFIFH